MCKTNEKTRQYYFFTAGQTVLQKLRKLKTWRVNYWLWRTKTKPNTTVFHSCTMTANIWENNKKIKAKNSCKNHPENKKSSNFFAAGRKYYGAAKGRWKSYIKKTKKTSQLFWDQSYFYWVKLVATLALFPAVL